MGALWIGIAALCATVLTRMAVYIADTAEMIRGEDDEEARR